MKTTLVGIFLTLVSFSSLAQNMTSKEKVVIYNGCMPSCQKNQKAMPENAILKDVPFVLDAYCSCYCARVSMRMTRSQSEVMARAALEGRDITQVGTLGKLINDSSDKCLAAFTE